MRKPVAFLVLLVLMASSVSANNVFDIRLVTQSINCETNEVCYDVQIKSGNTDLWRFSGQNYRLFYNGELAEFSHTVRVLDEPYAAPAVRQDLQHLDLSAQGNLSFDENLSWLNYYIDMNVAQQGNLLSPDVWTTTSTICFNSLVDIDTNPDICYEMIWARSALTFNYATAFVEISEWEDINQTNENITGSEYFDLTSENGDEACLASMCSDNNPEYTLRTILKSSDANTNISCYAVEVKSSDARNYVLGDVDMSFLYDGSFASFSSVSTSIDGYSTAELDYLLENRVVSDGPGIVNFEENISALSFSMSQDGGAVMLQGATYTEVAEICLDYSGSTADSTDCFELVYADENISDNYQLIQSVITSATDAELALTTAKNYNKCQPNSCDGMPLLVSNGDVTICAGDAIPTISVSPVTGITVRWYATMQGGVPVGMGESFNPTSGGIYYAEAFDESTNCFAENRVAVAVVANPLPNMTVLSKACSEDLSSYTLSLTTDATDVTASQGNVEKQIGEEWLISGLNPDQELTLTLNDAASGCSTTTEITAPNCECAAINEPISDGDKLICYGDDIPSISASLIQQNMTIDWYNTVDGGTPLVSGQLSYIPQNIISAGIYTYYAQARSTENGCNSGMRTEIMVNVLEVPVFAFVQSTCSADQSSYSAVVSSNVSSIITDVGTVTNNGDDTWTISGIPSTTNASLTLLGDGGCRMDQIISAPSCDCEDVEAPVTYPLKTTCDGISAEAFVATVPQNHSVRWYDAAVGGTLLSEGLSFGPNIAGTYYAEAINDNTGCVSSERAESELIIYPVPNLQTSSNVFCTGSTVTWENAVIDLNNTVGETRVFATLDDALNDVNPLTSTSIVVDEVASYFIKKTTAFGCYDIETVIIVPEDCNSSCLVTAGTYEAVPGSCYDGLTATIAVNQLTAPQIPMGFNQAFIVADANTLEVIDLSIETSYTVAATGSYSIHSFVVKEFDPAFDTIPELENLTQLHGYLEQGGGDICAALDLQGVRFDVSICTETCLAFTLNPVPDDISCYNGTPLELSVSFNPLDVFIPNGYVQGYVVSEGANNQIINVSDLNVNAPGDYTVHSVVYNPVNTSLTEFLGITAIAAYTRTIEGGGDLCASFDVVGAAFTVVECIDDNEIDLALTKTVNNPSARVGEEVTFTIEVTNQSTFAATGVSVVDVLPNGYATVDDISGNGVVSDNTITWEGLELDANGLERLSFTAIVQDNGPDTDYKNVAQIAAADQDDIDSSPNNDDGDQSEDDEDFAIVNAQEGLVDLALVKTSLQSQASIGDEVTFNINVSNQSMVTATGVMIRDVIPNGYDLGSISNISNGGTVTNGEIVWSDLSLGFFSSMNLSYSVELVNGSDYRNVVQITAADQGDVDSTPNNDDGDQSEDDESSATITVIAPYIDLSIEKEVFGTTPSIGDFVQFQVIIYNSGIIEGTGIALSDMIPIDGYDISTIRNMNPAGQIVGNTIVWSDISIEAGDEEAFTFEIAVLGGTDYKNVAQIVSANEQDIDSNPNNDDGDQSEDDEDFAIVVPEGTLEIIDLELVKSVDELQPAPGDVVNYEITLFNKGPSVATNIQVEDRLPNSLDPFNVDSGNINDDVITWDIPSLGVGESIDFSYSAMVFISDTDEYTNVAQVVEAVQVDIDSEIRNDDGDQSEDDEDSATIFPIIDNNLIDLELIKGKMVSCVAMNDVIDFYLDITNNSTAIATGVAVEDELSTGLLNPMNLSNGGVAAGQRLRWADLSLTPGETLRLTYTAVMGTNATVFTNRAQIIAADQEDVDSSPNNDDGDQSEDDEDILVMDMGASRFDLALEKTVDNAFAQPGERVTFEVTVINEGCIDATGVIVRDILPSGYRAIRDISDLGDLDGNVIIWDNISVAAGESYALSLTAEVVHFMINCDYVNIAEIISVDNWEDKDSSPGNDDGDQSEDDEASAEVYAGTMADVELTMEADKTAVTQGDEVTYILMLCNNGPANATNVAVRDFLPAGLQIIGELNYKGELSGDQITWSNFTIVSGRCLELEVNALVLAGTSVITNTAEVILGNEVDPDSNPGNGDESEDDYASVSIDYLAPAVLFDPLDVSSEVEVAINTALFLEGAYSNHTGQMTNILNSLGYLPGQKPNSFFAQATPAGQPYNTAPWHYEGTEGGIYDKSSDAPVSYAEDVVDWVLISLRTDPSLGSTVLTRAALLRTDGSVVLPEDAEAVLIDDTQEYYLVVQHRNHLPIMSPKKLSVQDGELSFDFRSNESYTALLGSGQKDVNGIYCVYAANGDQLRQALSANDINVHDATIWSESNGLHSAYMDSDFNMDGDVNVKDQIMWLLNNGAFSDVPNK